jgi:hypothetical protein
MILQPAPFSLTIKNRATASDKQMILNPEPVSGKDTTMIKYGELNRALLLYTSRDIHESIPIECYRRIMKAWFRANNSGMHWDVQQAAAVLLYIAFNEDFIRPSQLNADGLSILDWAEKFLDQLGGITTNREVIRALSVV